MQFCSEDKKAFSRQKGAELQIELWTQAAVYESCRSCSLSTSFSKTTVASVAQQYYGVLLARPIRASITINRGAGGCSISHKLDIARTVASKTPVFRLVNWGSAFDEEIIKNVSDFDVLLRTSIKKIERLFRNSSISTRG